jgi:hypothetical protein
VRLARSTDPTVTVEEFALSCMSVATTHAAGRAALLSVRGAAAALEAELARLRACPLPRHAPELARFEAFRSAIAAALRRLRDPRARQEHEPPGDGPPPDSDGTAPLRGLPVVCIACGAAPSPGRQLAQCGACRGPERWCSVACQRKSWATHKLECRVRTERAAPPAGAQAGAGGSPTARTEAGAAGGT